jgi:hypothetical protein
LEVRSLKLFSLGKHPGIVQMEFNSSTQTHHTQDLETWEKPAPNMELLKHYL